MSYLATKRRRDLVRRKWQFGAAAATVFLGVMLFALSYDAYRNLDVSYKGTYERLAFADMTVTGAGDGFADDARGVHGVAAVESRRQADVPIRIDGTDTFIGRLVGMPPDSQPDINRVDVREGEYLATGSPDEVLGEIHMADYWGLAPGDTVEYFDGAEWHEVTLRGTAISPEYIWPARSSQEVITTPDSFGVLFVAETVIDDLPEAIVEQQTLVLYEADANVGTLDDRIESLSRSADAASAVAQADQPSNKALSLDLLGFEQMAYAFPALFLLAAGMATYTLLNRLVYSERQLIGTLRANGMSRRTVVRHYLSYGLWVGVVAAVAGLAAGMPLGWFSTYLYTEELGIPDTIRELRWITPVIGLLFGVVTGALSAWVPARSASRLDPAEAMRGEAPVESGHHSLLERALPFLKRLPVRWRMTLRGIGRNKRRSFSTVLGVVLALVLILSSWGLMDTIVYLLDKQFNEIQLNDSTVLFERAVTTDDVAEIERIEGIETAEIVYSAGVSVKGPDGSYETQLQAFEPDTRMHAFEGTTLPDEDEIILGSALRDTLGVEVGDRVDLSFTGLETDAKVTVAGFAEEALGTFAYMQDAALVDLLGRADPPVEIERIEQPDVSVVMTRYESDVDREQLARTTEDIDGVAAVNDARVLYLTVQDYMGLFFVFIALMLTFGGAMAFALIFNTMSVNLAERAGELANMRANGLSRRKTAALVVGENVLLTLIGIPPGLVLGYWAADALMASYSSDLFSFPLYIQPMTYVWCALAMIVVTLISLWPGIHAASRVDIGTIVRQRGV